MTADAVSILESVLWLLGVFVVIALWFVAMSDIASRVRNDLFTRTQLAYMAAIVSVVAIMSVGSSGAVLLQLQTGTVSDKSGSLPGANYRGCGGARSSFVFSFGLDRAIYPSDRGATANTETKTHRLCHSHG